MRNKEPLLQAKAQSEQQISLQIQNESLLQENDIIKIINLEERYNYFKSLIKLQRLNNFNEDQNENRLLEIMHQLIDYYGECICEAELTIQNIIFYFQQKLKDLNRHYKSIIDRKKLDNHKEIVPKIDKNKSQLGQIKLDDSLFRLENEFLAKNQQLQSTSNMKNYHNKSLMVAIQSQNIQEHLSNNIKKVDFLKKSIANSIHDQEALLENRMKNKRKKISIERSKHGTPQSISTEATVQRKIDKTIKRKRQAYSSFHTIYHSRLSSDSELDQADSLYISTYNIEDELKSQLAVNRA